MASNGRARGRNSNTATSTNNGQGYCPTTTTLSHAEWWLATFMHSVLVAYEEKCMSYALGSKCLKTYVRKQRNTGQHCYIESTGLGANDAWCAMG